MKWLLTCLVLLLCAPACAEDNRIVEGRRVAEAFLSGDLQQAWEEFSPEVRRLFGTVEGLRSFRDQLSSGFGTETGLLDEKVETADGAEVYVRRSQWSSSDAPVVLKLAIGTNDQITGFEVGSEPTLADSRFLQYETRAELRLPFEGEWFVVWGGRTLEQNYHAADRAQRFAMDVLVYRDGATHQGDPQMLESYHCWGQPILAPADAKVAKSVADLPDNAIGSTDARNPAGNHLVLDFGNGEFGFLAHMQKGSIPVEVGDDVLAGQQLGRCGNSGNTSEPHLHFHLQTTPDLTNGEGLPAFFNDYVANGATIRRGEPQAGEVVTSGRS